MNPIDALRSLPVLRFALMFSPRGACNFGATGMSDAATHAAERLGVVEVWYRKSPNMDLPVRRRRLYRAVQTSLKGRDFATCFRAALRDRNLPAIAGLEDGEGRVAFNAAWKERKGDIVEAALAAWAGVASQ